MTNTQIRHLPDRPWFKSSYSEGSGNACVEVAFASGTVKVRDSKDINLPALTMSPTSWALFIPTVAD
ncbi:MULTISPECIES: DUF397 domain-containing protein [unclassified Streptomyces]|uniref:DUF397 domain-containing protein n=1 Tax=unclassified Streptomyces TaxID=2593676 RepID=UPI003811FF07